VVAFEAAIVPHEVVGKHMAATEAGTGPINV